MHVVDRVVQPFERCLDEFRAHDRFVAPGDQHLGAQLADQSVRRHLRLDEAVTVAADGVDVREVREQRAEQVAHHRDAVFGQPHDGAVDRLADRGVQLDAQPVDVEGDAVVEQRSGFGTDCAIDTPGFSLAMRIASVPSMSNQMAAVRARSPWMRVSSAWHAGLFACAT